MKTGRFIELLMILFIFAGCSGPDTYTVETIDGVRHVHNLAPLWGDEQKIKLEFVRKIGDLEGNDDNYHFYEPEDVVVDSKGSVFILDTGNFKVKKFDSEGGFITSFGGQGQGPGEFELVSGIDINDEGIIYIYDLGFLGFHVFDTDGKFIRSFKNGIMTLQIEFLNTGDLVAMNYASEDPLNSNKKPLVAVFDKEGTLQKEFGLRKTFEDDRMKFTGNIFSFTTDGKDDIYLSFWYQNRIEKYSKDGELLLKTDRKLNYNESSEIIYKEQKHEDGRTTISSIVNQFSTAIQVDREGRIWVQTFEKQLEEEEVTGSKAPKENPFMFEVFDREGVLLCNIKHEEGIFPSKIKIYDDRLFIINYLDMCIYEYRIVER